MTPALSARLHKQSTFRKPAKLDRCETEMFRKRTNLRYGVVIVARQEHDSPATMYGRILIERRGDQMVEALDQSRTRKSLSDELGRRLSCQSLRGHPVSIGHIDNGLPLPVGKRLCDIRCDSKRTARKMMSALTASASVVGMTVGPIAAASDAKLSGSRVVATDTSMPLRANVLARALPILPKPIIA